MSVDGPQITATNWTNCTHHWKRAGFQAIDGKQRWKCRVCGKYCTENRTRVLPFEAMTILGPYFKRQNSIRFTARMTGLDRITVRKYFKKFSDWKESRELQNGSQQQPGSVHN